MMPTLYGIKSCDTCRKARQWLDQADIGYDWIDLREHGVTRQRLNAWREALGDAALINKRSQAWRDLDEPARAAVGSDPIPVLVEQPTLVKRPILETACDTLAGFSAARYEAALTGDR